MNKPRTTIVTLLLACLVIAAFPFSTQKSEAASTQVENVFSIMHISDTQHLAFLNPALYNDTTSWIVNNSASFNLKMVIHTGDFIDAFAGPPIVAYNVTQRTQEWAVANAAMVKLLNAGIPYCWCAGNHDQSTYGNSSTTLGVGSNFTAFNATSMRSKSYWVADIFDSKNTAVKFAVNNFQFMVIDIENLANSSTIAWMKGLLDNSAGINVIVATHDYLFGDGTYDTATNAVGNWTQSLKTTLDVYPNVFLTLCGHNRGSNMTKSGSRQELLFDLQDENNMTGAAAVRIYTFDLTTKKVNASTYAIDTKTWLTDPFSQFTFDASLTSNWTLTTDARAMKAYPELQESIWQKDTQMKPNGPYDKIGLHRLVKTGITPQGVVFVLPWAYSSGELLMSNPPADSWAKFENYSVAIYWANRGFDVYSIDYRNYFIPQEINASQAGYLKNVDPSQLSFMGNWGWTQWIGDIKEAVNKAKEVSGANKLFLAGMSYGGESAMNYATMYWKEDLRGIILLDGVQTGYGFGAPEWARIGGETNILNLTTSLTNMNLTKTWFTEMGPGFIYTQKAYISNLSAPAVSIWTGAPLVNSATNKTFANYSDYSAFARNGPQSNIAGGYANVSQVVYNLAYTVRYMPARLSLESQSMINWTNCPYLPYDFDDHYNEIGVPVLAFASGLAANATGTFRFVNGLNTTDFTGIMLPNYGHLDVFYGTYSARDVSAPAYTWMVNHLPVQSPEPTPTPTITPTITPTPKPVPTTTQPTVTPTATLAPTPSQTNTTSTPTPQPLITVSPSPTQQPTAINSPTPLPTNANSEFSLTTDAIYVITGAVVIVAVVAIILLTRKRRK